MRKFLPSRGKILLLEKSLTSRSRIFCLKILDLEGRIFPSRGKFFPRAGQEFTDYFDGGRRREGQDGGLAECGGCRGRPGGLPTGRGLRAAGLPHSDQHAMVTTADQRRPSKTTQTTMQSRSAALLTLLVCDTSTDSSKVTLLCLSSRLCRLMWQGGAEAAEKHD